MNIIGDIHGDFEWYENKVLTNPDIDKSIQVGDYGVGFYPHLDNILDHDYAQHKCIAGNHDDRNILQKYGTRTSVTYNISRFNMNKLFIS